MAITPVATLGDVLLDMVEADNPSHTYEITDRAVEEGENVSDHMKAQPVTLSISGVVVGDDAWPRLQRLRQYQENCELVTYVNRVIYTNMAIESIETSHGVDIANGFSFDIQLKRIKKASPKEIQITKVPPAVQTKAKKTKNAGTKQSAKTGKKTTTDVTLADKIRDFQKDTKD